MKIKFVGEAPIRHGDQLVSQGDELDIIESEAQALVASGLFETIKKKTAKAKKADKADEPEAEKTEGAE